MLTYRNRNVRSESPFGRTRSRRRVNTRLLRVAQNVLVGSKNLHVFSVPQSLGGSRHNIRVEDTEGRVGSCSVQGRKTDGKTETTLVGPSRLSEPRGLGGSCPRLVASKVFVSTPFHTLDTLEAQEFWTVGYALGTKGSPTHPSCSQDERGRRQDEKSSVSKVRL